MHTNLFLSYLPCAPQHMAHQLARSLPDMLPSTLLGSCSTASAIPLEDGQLHQKEGEYLYNILYYMTRDAQECCAHRLSAEVAAPSMATWKRFGNTSVASTYNILANIESQVSPSYYSHPLQQPILTEPKKLRLA